MLSNVGNGFATFFTDWSCIQFNTNLFITLILWYPFHSFIPIYTIISNSIVIEEDFEVSHLKHLKIDKNASPGKKSSLSLIITSK